MVEVQSGSGGSVTLNDRELKSNLDELSRNLNVVADKMRQAFEGFGVALEQCAEAIIKASYEIPMDAYHALGMLHPDEIEAQRRIERDLYLLLDAPPDEVVDHIISQPNHTWHGLTIYPDEAWRYRGNDYWMEWRR